MSNLLTNLRSQALSISEKEINCGFRGFNVPKKKVRERIESIGECFLHGYHLAINSTDTLLLTEKLNEVNLEDRGFAFEGF